MATNSDLIRTPRRKRPATRSDQAVGQPPVPPQPHVIRVGASLANTFGFGLAADK